MTRTNPVYHPLMNRRLLASLSFPAVILAGLLAWSAYKEATRAPAPQSWRIGLYCLSAGLCLGIAARGIRERHRSAGED
jgi:hypothetical protein